MGDVFPTNDPLALWAMGLSVISNDLILSYNYLLSTFKKAGKDINPEGLYFLLLSGAHLFEAVRFLQYADSLPQVKDFISSLPSTATDQYKRIRTEGEGDWFNKKMRLLRNGFFHYPALNHPKFKESEWKFKYFLLKLKDEVTHLTVGEAIGQFRAIYADQLRVDMTLGPSGEENYKQEYEEVVEKVKELTDVVINFSQVALTEFYKQKRNASPNIFEIIEEPERDTEEIIIEAIRENPNNPEEYYYLACCQALRYKKEEALANLSIAANKGCAEWLLMKDDDDLYNIRSDPRFGKIAEMIYNNWRVRSDKAKNA